MKFRESLPCRTMQIPPPPGELLAWDERLKRYVKTSDAEVIAQPKVYPFWMPDRRKARRGN